ncbi:hypothetical protein DIPPA_02676 [Diplonema papillatum]|nr:hypothetical protein DIPPA_02676 [Diplonema papillatum]
MEVMSTARQTRLPPLSTCRADGDTPRCAVAVGGWLPDGSDEDVLFAEEALFKRQAWCDEKRTRHEVEAGATERRTSCAAVCRRRRGHRDVTHFKPP